MSNKHYISGRNFEWKVRDFFEDKGFIVVRSAGSHTPIDLVVFNEISVLLIQCKHGKIIKSEITEFIKISKRFNSNPEYIFLVATAERNGKTVDIVFYHVTPAGNLIRNDGGI